MEEERRAAAPSNVVLVPLHHHPDLTESCAKLLNQTWKRSLGARMHSLERSSDEFPLCLVLIGAPEGPALGHARLCRVLGLQDSLFVESVVVNEELRGKGYGRKLMEATERYARGKGFRNLYLTTHDKQDFYHHLGYHLSEPVQSMGSLNSLLPAAMIQKMAACNMNLTANHHLVSSPAPPCPPLPTAPPLSTASPPAPPCPPLPIASPSAPPLSTASPPAPPCPPLPSASPPLCPPLPTASPPPCPPLPTASPPPCPLLPTATSLPPPPPPGLCSTSPALPPPPPRKPVLPTSTADQGRAVSSLHTPYRDFRGDPIFWMKKHLNMIGGSSRGC